MMMKLSKASLLLLVASVPSTAAFSASKWKNDLSKSTTATTVRHTKTGLQASESESATTTTQQSEELIARKKELLQLLGGKKFQDPVLADPITKEPVVITTPGVLFGGDTSRRNVQYKIESPSNRFKGSTDTFIDLLEPATESDNESSSTSSPLAGVLKQTIPYIPPPLRQSIASLTDGEFVPMRDLFTSPAVSFAYERGWRQNFAVAGFPGPDEEARMAMEYFSPVVADVGASNATVVDMSCATGLFTRRFAAEDTYGRVLGCDYSESMLTEARRRIDSERKLKALKTTRLDLVRLDVGQIPMKKESVDCLHAGAAMHCWPDLDAAASEIFRVLKPGGRYFATTFLSSYFRALSAADGAGGANTASQQAFQYFESVDTLRSLLERGGFEREKILIEVLGNACVVIRAEK